VLLSNQVHPCFFYRGIPYALLILALRGALNRRGVEAIFEKHKTLTGIGNLHCHILRHVFSINFISSAEKEDIVCSILFSLKIFIKNVFLSKKLMFA
jgi:hypothetical protein